MFTAGAYTVREEESMVDVCVVLEGNTEIPITVVLSLQQDDQVPANMRATRKLSPCSKQYSTCQFCRWTDIYSVFLTLSYAVGSDVNSITESEVILAPDDSQSPICRSVTPINDEIFENTEVFLVSMTTSRDRVEVDSPVQVSILDNDG